MLFLFLSNVENLAHSIMETIDKSPNTKRKAISPVKKSPSSKKVKVDDSDSKSCNLMKSPDTENLKESVKAERKQEILPETCGLEKSLPDVCGVNSTDVNSQLHANGSEMKEDQDKSLLSPAVVKGKKKPLSSKKTAKKKKSTKKKSSLQMDDDEDFAIDPRLGGSKIKKAVKKKGKDSKSKGVEVDSKKARISELRFPYIHIEGAWNLPQVVKIVNGHVKVSVS